MNVSFCQIIALNKTKERMRPYQGNQEDDDPDIKKIKKVSMQSSVLERRNVGWEVYFCILVCLVLSSFIFIKYSQITRFLLPCPNLNVLNYISFLFQCHIYPLMYLLLKYSF